MNTQPEALRLIEWFDEEDGFAQGTKAHHKWVLQAHSELRRLHEVNQGLLKTLESYEAENEKLWGLVSGFINSAKAKEQA